MNNKWRGVKTTEQNCKVKTVIEVESEKYNSDLAYSKSINSSLNQLFKHDINPTK